MKRFFKVLLSLIVGAIFLMAFSTPSGALEIGARVYYWFPTLKTDARVDSTTVKGTEFNFQDDLGVGYKYYPSLEIYGGLGKNHLSVMYTEANYSGNSTLTNPISFNGTPFAAGTSVSTDLKIRMFDLEYQRDLLNMENILAGFSLGAIGKIKYIEGDAKLSAVGVGASDTIRVPMPMIGVGAHMGILANILEARAKITGISYSGNYLYEALADLSLTPFPLIDIHAGYKIIKLHVNDDDVYFDSEFTGPFVALTVGF